jgi:hypothetical protein
MTTKSSKMNNNRIESMTYGEKRSNIILINYAKGKYDLPYLKDTLKRGLEHVDRYGVMGVDKKFILNLSHIEAAIKIIERQKRNGD